MVLDSLLILSLNGIFVYDHLSYLCIVLVDFSVSIANFHLTTWRSCQGCNSNSCGCVRQMRHLEFDGWGIVGNFRCCLFGNDFVRKRLGKFNTFFQIFALYMPVWIHEPSCFNIFWNSFLQHVSSCVRLLQYLFLWLYRIQFPGQECFRGSSRLSGALTWVGHGRRCNHGGSSEVLAPPTGNIIAVDELTCFMKGRDENQVTLMNGWYPGWWNKHPAIQGYPGLSSWYLVLFRKYLSSMNSSVFSKCEPSSSDDWVPLKSLWNRLKWFNKIVRMSGKKHMNFLPLFVERCGNTTVSNTVTIQWHLPSIYKHLSIPMMHGCKHDGFV